jgi:steroid delta-isomerase-like uncharacterized protein
VTAACFGYVRKKHQEESINMTKLNTKSESVLVGDSRLAVQEGVSLSDEGLGTPSSPRSLLQFALAALNDRRISEVVGEFSESFKFSDHGLTLEMTDKMRLTEFFEKSRELFPDAALEVMSVIDSRDQAVAEWKLTATQTVPFFGNTNYCVPISARGVTVVRAEQGKIVEWSDYYDQSSSRRMSLAAHFTEWIEY